MSPPKMPKITLEWNEARMWWDVTYDGPNNRASFGKLEGALGDIRKTVAYWWEQHHEYYAAKQKPGRAE